MEEKVKDIYKCLIHFKEDLRNNIAFLSIITSQKLYYYPEYISERRKKGKVDVSPSVISCKYPILSSNLIYYTFYLNDFVNFSLLHSLNHYIVFLSYSIKLNNKSIIITSFIIRRKKGKREDKKRKGKGRKKEKGEGKRKEKKML
jgi:hypothetical protein